MFSEDDPLAYTESEHLHYRVTMTEEVNRATSRTISPAVENHKALQDQTVRDGGGEVKLDLHKPELGHHRGAGANDGVTAWRPTRARCRPLRAKSLDRGDSLDANVDLLPDDPLTTIDPQVSK